MKVKISVRRWGFAALILLCLSGAACASLLDKYEKGLDGTGAPAHSQPKSKTPATSRPPQPQARESAAGNLQPGSIVIPPDYVKAILKEHANFVECYTRADRNILFYLLSGKRRVPPNAAQVRAMRKKIDLDLRLLASSARRYANNLRHARLAWEKAPLEEKNLVTSLLSYLFATPAWGAVGLNRAEGMGVHLMTHHVEQSLSALGNLYSGPGILDDLTPKQGAELWDRFKSSYPAQVMATGAKFGAVVAGTVAGAVLIVSTVPLSSVAGVFLLSTTIVGGGLAAVSSGADLVDAIKDDGSNVLDKKTRDIIDKAGLGFSLINVGVNVHGIATSQIKAEVVQGALSTVEEAIGFWNAKEEAEKTRKNEEMEAILKSSGNQGDGGKDGGGGGGGGHGH